MLDDKKLQLDYNLRRPSLYLKFVNNQSMCVSYRISGQVAYIFIYIYVCVCITNFFVTRTPNIYSASNFQTYMSIIIDYVHYSVQ